MFNFLNPAVLFAATAALIPLIIHLFSRRKVKIIEFSSVRHLQAMQRRQVRRLKIRQLLLLLIRMLIILAIVLAFARPTTRQSDLGTHATISAVILLDNSASMNRYVADGNLFELARTRAEALLAGFSQADEISIIPLDPVSRPATGVGFTTAAVAGEQLSQLDVGQGRADWASALELAAGLLDDAINLNRELYVISDRQRTSLPDRAAVLPDNVSSYYVEVSDDEFDNLGIVDVNFGGQLLQAGHDFALTATVRNFGPEDSDDLIASLYLDNRRVAQTDFTVSANDESTVKFNRAVSTTGLHSGYVEISDDRFAADNKYYFSFSIPEQFNLLLIDADPASSFVSLALVPDQTLGGYWSVKTAQPNELSGVDFNAYDVIMLLGTPPLNQSYVNRLHNAVQRGRSLFLTYGSNTEMQEFNDQWSVPSGLSITKPAREDFSKVGFYTLQTIDNDHPIFSVFDASPDALPQMKFYTLPTVRTDEDARIIMRFSGDRPALVESSFGRGRILTFAAPIAPPYTDLVSHSFFVPFVSRLAEYLASDLSQLDVRLFCGQAITRTLTGINSADVPVTVVQPDASTLQLIPEEDKGSLTVRLPAVGQAGIYSLAYGGRETDRFAVNLNPTEADLTPVDADQLGAALGISELRRIESDDDPAVTLAEFRIGRELWSWFLWAAVLLLVAESLLGRGSRTEE